MTRTFRGIPINQLLQWKTGNLGFTLLGLFFLLFPWFSSGVFNTTVALFGMMFLSAGIIRAKSKCTALGGFFAACLGICYFFASFAFIDAAFLWTASILLFVGFLIFELNVVKFGPSTSKAKAFIVVPLSLLSFSLILAFVGKNPMITIEWTNLFVSLNYLSILLFSMLTLFDIGGWRIAGSKTNLWIMLFAVAAIATAFLGTYQGTLFQWS